LIISYIKPVQTIEQAFLKTIRTIVKQN